MLTDFHCHVLPELDDGSENVGMSAEMIGLLREQGVERIIATPHFYAHREKSTDRFLEKRSHSFEKLRSSGVSTDNIFLGAEISIERGLSEIQGIEKLAIGGTNLILLEFPYSGFSDWMTEEIHNISCEFSLMPVIAHLHRYIGIFSRKEMETVLELKAVFQINNEAFSGFRSKKFVQKLIKNDFEFVFESDSHNLTDRKPNFDILKKTFRKNADIIGRSDDLFDKHKRV